MAMKLAAALVLAVLSASCADGQRLPPPPANDAGPGQLALIESGQAGPAAAATMVPPNRSLVAKALAEVAPSHPDVAEYFFVGVAGWASEDVFLNEAQAAADLFGRRFGAGGRTLILANNPRTRGLLPRATVPGLEAAIDGIAKKMGKEDVLFLYITSHGERGRVSLRDDGEDLPDLRAEALRGILDRAGITYRVVAISACYSGSFIEALENENTLVMTAAAADRPSFGCGHDGPFTYFGRALIGEALPRELSFERAFAAAAASIAAREKVEGLKPSRPQIFVGAAIGPVLDSITRRLGENR